jgi:ATP-binding cassette subfamily F protein uup
LFTDKVCLYHRNSSAIWQGNLTKHHHHHHHSTVLSFCV